VIHISSPDLKGQETAYVTEAVESTWISSAGKFVSEFESAFADLVGVRHAIATNNGTTALHLALAALGIGPGDEVVVPALTYIATANAVTYCGATPVLADVDLATMNLDPGDFERRVTSRTRAVIPVHLYGQPADMQSICAVARAHDVVVVEDAAEAHGATIDGRAVGSIGDVGAFSFFGNKIVTTGEGGAVTTDDDELAARLRLLRGQGMDPERRYWFSTVGFNYRMTNVAAAIGLAQLERISSLLKRRREIGQLYERTLRGMPRVIRPAEIPGATRVDWLYTVRIDGFDSDRRNALIAAMAADGIETRPVFYPLHLMPPYLGEVGAHPAAERAGAEGISLPTHTLLSDAEVGIVCESLSRHVSRLAE